SSTLFRSAAKILPLSNKRMSVVPRFRFQASISIIPGTRELRSTGASSLSGFASSTAGQLEKRAASGREMKVEETEAYKIEIPTWRMDIERGIDVIEEIARVYGFNRFENTLPAFIGSSVELPDASKESVLR